MRDQQRVLLFGDDGSQASDAAWLWINNHRWPAWQLDRRTASTITTAGVGPARPVRRVDRTPFTEAEFAHEQSSFVDGDPRLVLDAVADADLLAVGYHGWSGLRAVWMGSTTSWLMRDPVSPLVIIKHGQATRSVLVAVDGSPHSNAAVSALLTLPWIGNLHTIVVSVDDGRTNAEAAVSSAAERLAGSVASVTTQVLKDHATDALIAALEPAHPDLVVMGTRGLTGWERLTVGSSAAAVLHHVTSNVLLACAVGGSLDID